MFLLQGAEAVFLASLPRCPTLAPQQLTHSVLGALGTLCSECEVNAKAVFSLTCFLRLTALGEGVNYKIKDHIECR